jgi:hypothetical protein
MTAVTAPTYTSIRCGNRKAHGEGVYHESLAVVRDCFAGRFDDDGYLEAEMAYERRLEDRGYWEAQAQDAYEARNGVIGFREAWHLASPDTCPCCN